MSTQAVAADRKLTRYFRSPDQDGCGGWNIAMRITLHSDANRVFQALTRPEFLETWIALPGDNTGSCLVASQQGASYRFDHYRDGIRDLIISGVYRICRRRKMLFTWHTGNRVTGPDSLVYIGLYGNFASTVLELHHRGLASDQEYLWQQEMWNYSLDRLKRIFHR